MPLADPNVRDGGTLHVLLAAVGTAAPTQTLIDAFNADSGSMGNETQRVAITGGPTGGTFPLTFNGETATGIAYNATASAIQTALEGLGRVAPGDIAATGGPLPGTPVDVEFTGKYSGKDVPGMTTSSTGLTGGTSPTVTVTDDYIAASPWSNLGHTDLDEDAEMDEEGGDSEVRGSRQNPALRERVEPVTQFLVINSIQVDADTLTYYFGEGTVSNGVFETNGTFPTLERAGLLIFIDGDTRSGLHWPKASIRRNGAPTVAKDGFRRFPLRVTPLKMADQPLQRWIDPSIISLA